MVSVVTILALFAVQVLPLSRHFDQPLPERMALLYRADEDVPFTRVDAVPIVGRHSFALGAPEATIRELILTFSGPTEVDELEILGEPIVGVDTAPARPHLIERGAIEPVLAEHLPVVRSAAAIEKEQREKRIRSAYVEPDGTLSMFAQLDWESLAREAIADVDVVESDEIRRRWGETYWSICDCYRVEYDVAGIPERLNGSYYYVSSDGVQRAMPEKLRGLVTFGDVGEHVVRRHSGRVIFSVEGEPPPGGFIWFADEPLDFHVVAVAEGDFGVDVVDDDTSAYLLSLPDGRELGRELPTRQMEHVPEAVAVYRLRVSTGEDVLFVQWAPDESCDFACCAHAFELFDVRDDLASLHWTRYGCDV